MRVQLSVVLHVDEDSWTELWHETPTPQLVAEWLAELVEVSKGRDAGAAELERCRVIGRR